jgi:hypothetical protein
MNRISNRVDENVVEDVNVLQQFEQNVIWLIGVILGVYMIYTGNKYSSVQCETQIALWLFVSGLAVTCIHALVGIVIMLWRRGCITVGYNCIVAIVCTGCGNLLFLITWFALGNVWVFGCDKTKCNSYLWANGFWLIIIYYVYYGLLGCVALAHVLNIIQEEYGKDAFQRQYRDDDEAGWTQA